MSMKPTGWIAVFVWLVISVSADASAAAVWWNNNAFVSRFEPETAYLRTLAPPSRIRAVAALADGGAWVVHGQTLSRLRADFSVSINVDLNPGNQDARVLVVAADDGGIWVANGRMVRRFDGEGRALVEWMHANPIDALEVNGPCSLWIGDAQGIHQYTEDGTPQRLIALPDGAPLSALLADSAAGYLWMITSRHAIQYDVLAGFAEHVRLTLPIETASAAMDTATGTLWLLSRQRLHAFDRDALPVSSWPIPGETVFAASALAVDTGTERLWIGDSGGIVAVNLQAMQWIRLTSGDPATAVSAAHFHLRPNIVLGEVTAGPPATIRLQIGVLCNGEPCVVAPRYLQQIELHASLSGIDATDQFVVDRDAATAELRNAEALSIAPDPLRVSATDVYGNRSRVIELDLASLLAEGRFKQRVKLNALPAVSVTAPANNASFVAPASIAITAVASDSDGTIAKVEFYRDAVLLGTDTTSPYAFTWANAPVGNYALTAKAYDNAGGVKSSAIVNVQVKANVAPTVAITAPTNNSNYVAPATINLAASASDRDGTVSKIEFFRGSTKLATVTTPPYNFAWTSVAGGAYSLTAKATDNKGAVSTSPAVNVKVNKPPVVALSAPADNTILQTPTSITITATASDGDGSISKVEFLRDGIVLGSDATSPYSFVWSNIPTGTFVLTARATDNLGATTTSAAKTLKVNANQVPVVVLTPPAGDAKFIDGVPVTLAATATDADGTIVKVEFFANTVTYGNRQVGTDTTNPYSINATLHVGSNILTAVATDNKGAQTTSAPITIAVVANLPPAITLTSPINGQSFPAMTPPDIMVSANASDPDGRIVDVKFYVLPSASADNPVPVPVLIGTALAPPYQVVWRGVPFAERYEVTALATDDGGYEAADTAYVSVVNASPWSIQITAPDDRYPIVFNAPATIVLNLATIAQPAAGDPVAKVEFIADGNVIGTILGSPNGANGEYVHVWRNLGSGTRLVTGRLYDAAGFIVESPPITIRVRDATQSPTVAVTAPANGHSVLPLVSGLPTDTYVTAMASDIDGAITRVEIITDDAVRFVGAGASLTGIWSGISAGVHVVSAAATDNGFARATGKPVYIESVPMPRLQAVVLTSPSPGAVTVPFVLAADVGAPDGNIEKVVFYDGTTLLGTVTTPPYSLLIASGNGSRSFTAMAKLHNSVSVTSTPVAVTVSGSNSLPTANLTAPTTGQVFNVGAVVPMSANASDSNGSIAKVEFFVGTTLVATATTAPYTGSWIPAAAGAYTIKAKATDNQLGTSWSNPVNVTVITNTPPQVSLTAPAAGQTFFAGVPFTISASATDTGGQVAKVEFFAGSTLIGTVTSLPFAINWSAPAAGAYVITARATDNSNASTTSSGVSVTVAVNAIPTVALAMPRTGQAFVTGDVISLIASAGDGEGAIARVEFYAGTSLLGSAVAAPFTYAWTGAATGNHVLTARVVDVVGAVTISAPAIITVQPLTLTVTSPAPSASVAADFILITGTFTAPANSGVTVNGAVAATDGQGKFVFNNLPLEFGSNSVEITLTTLSGQSISQNLTVTSTGDSPFQIVVDPGEGMAPLQTKLRYSARAGSVASFRVDNLGSGSLDSSQFGPEVLGVLNFATPGIYQPLITVVYDGGLTYTQALSVIVRDPAAVDQGFLWMLSDFTTALKHEYKSAAMPLLSAPMQAKFGPIFDTLGPTLPHAMETFKGFGAIYLGAEIASYAVKRQSIGKTKIYMLDFLRDLDGVWRIDSM